MTVLYVIMFLIILYVAYDVYKTIAFLRRAYFHVGHVLEIHDKGGGYEPYYSYTVEINRGVDDPHKVEVDVGYHSPSNLKKVGDEVEIIYDPLKNKGCLDTPWQVFGKSLIGLFVLALLFVIAMKSS
jgi:hypothetical protein